MESTHEADLDVPSLPAAARKAHIFPSLSAGPLISIGQLCDSGCTAIFTATQVTIELDDSVILTGTRSPATRLWNVDLPSSPRPKGLGFDSPANLPRDQANAAVSLSATPAELVAFAHASLFSPALTTLNAALDKNFLPQLPGLTGRTLRKHPPLSAPMLKGHMDHTRQNHRSTHPPVPATDDHADSFPPATTDGGRTHMCFAACMQSTGQIFTDQTGRFVIPSSTGNTQLLIIYDYDSNYIHAEPMKSKTGPAILAAYKRVHKIFCAAGLRPQLQRLDNDCSAALKEFMTAEGVDFQLVPPHVHRRNAAERAIRTFKNHFIAGLCSTDKAFPSTCGIDSSLRPFFLSISCAVPDSTPSCQPGPKSMAKSTSIEPPLRPQASAWSSTKPHRHELPGHPTQSMDGTSAQLRILIAVTASGSGRPEPNASPTPSHGFPQRSLCLLLPPSTQSSPVPTISSAL